MGISRLVEVWEEIAYQKHVLGRTRLAGPVRAPQLLDLPIGGPVELERDVQPGAHHAAAVSAAGSAHSIGCRNWRM